MSPREQRFQAIYFSIDPHHGLIENIEFTILERPAQGVFQLQTLQPQCDVFSHENFHSILARVFGAIHGQVGAVQQVGRGLAVLWKHRHTGAGSYE